MILQPKRNSTLKLVLNSHTRKFVDYDQIIRNPYPKNKFSSLNMGGYTTSSTFSREVKEQIARASSKSQNKKCAKCGKRRA